MGNAERWAVTGSIAGLVSALIAIAAWLWPTAPNPGPGPAPSPVIAATTSTTPGPGPTSGSPTPSDVVASTPPLIPATAAATVGIQWQGSLRVNDFGVLLSTRPPSPAQASPDIEPYTGGTIVTPHGAARWAGSRDPSAQDCAALVAEQSDTRFNVAPGDRFCVRVGQYGENPVALGQQYAFVQINGTGTSPSSLDYVDIYAAVWTPLS